MLLNVFQKRSIYEIIQYSEVWKNKNCVISVIIECLTMAVPFFIISLLFI